MDTAVNSNSAATAGAEYRVLEIWHYRVLAVAGAVIVPVMGFLQSRNDTPVYGATPFRLVISLICVAFAVSSFASEYVRGHPDVFALPIFYAIGGLGVYTLWASHLAVNNAIGLMRAMIAISVVMAEAEHILLFNALVISGAVIAVIFVPVPHFDSGTLIGSLISLALISGIVFSIRLKIQRRLAERTGELAVLNEQLNASKKNLEKEIAEKNDFFRTVSHDLGAPLRNIIGMVDSIVRRFGGELSDEAKDRLARTRRNAVVEMELISELLELSRIRTRRQAFSEANVGEIVSEVADSLASDLESRRIRFTTDDRWPTVWCEKARLAQVFQNLIDNAVKYMGKREDAHIHAGWREEDHRFVFYVQDNGAGIAAEDKERIFHVFRRGKTAAAQAEGRGVGLAAVKTVAGTYDGDAWVESELGRGSTFYVSLSKDRVLRQ